MIAHADRLKITPAYLPALYFEKNWRAYSVPFDLKSEEGHSALSWITELFAVSACRFKEIR